MDARRSRAGWRLRLRTGLERGSIPPAGAADPAAEAGWQAANDGHAADARRPVLRRADRLPVVPPAAPSGIPPWRTVYVAARQAPHHRHRGPRRFRRRPLPVCPTPTVLVVADWAFRKGHTYGAVLIDLERRQRVTLLPDREADTLATWLEEHPKVEIVAWDRAGTYAEGARRGALRAEQVADRFHLVQNLAAMLETVFTTHVAELHAVEQATLDADLGQAIRPGPSHREAPKQAKADERRERRLAKFLRLTKSS